jgi:hypothetical protein
MMPALGSSQHGHSNRGQLFKFSRGSISPLPIHNCLGGLSQLANGLKRWFTRRIIEAASNYPSWSPLRTGSARAQEVGSDLVERRVKLAQRRIKVDEIVGSIELCVKAYIWQTPAGESGRVTDGSSENQQAKHRSDGMSRVNG